MHCSLSLNEPPLGEVQPNNHFFISFSLCRTHVVPHSYSFLFWLSNACPGVVAGLRLGFAPTVAQDGRPYTGIPTAHLTTQPTSPTRPLASFQNSLGCTFSLHTRDFKRAAHLPPPLAKESSSMGRALAPHRLAPCVDTTHRFTVNVRGIPLTSQVISYMRTLRT